MLRDASAHVWNHGQGVCQIQAARPGRGGVGQKTPTASGEEAASQGPGGSAAGGKLPRKVSASVVEGRHGSHPDKPSWGRGGSGDWQRSRPNLATPGEIRERRRAAIRGRSWRGSTGLPPLIQASSPGGVSREWQRPLPARPNCPVAGSRRAADSCLAQLSQGFPGPTKSLPDPAILGGSPRGQHGPQPDPALLKEDAKAGAYRPACGTLPDTVRSPPGPSRPGSGDPQSGSPRGIRAGGARSRGIRRGRREVAGGRGAAGPGSRAARYSPARTSWLSPPRPGGQRHPRAGGSGPPAPLRAPARGPSALRLLGLPSVPGRRTVRRLQPRRACAARAAPPPVSAAGATLKARTPDLGLFLSAQLGGEARSPPLLAHPFQATSGRTSSRSPNQSPPPTLHVPGGWAPALWPWPAS